MRIQKLCVPETVEQRILEVCLPSLTCAVAVTDDYGSEQLQDKKRELAKAALSGDKMKNMRLGVDELAALFRPGSRDDEDSD